jgi:hypothetical protein
MLDDRLNTRFPARVIASVRLSSFRYIRPTTNGPTCARRHRMAQRSSTLFIPDGIIRFMFCSSCQLSDHAQGLSDIYHRISLTIQGLQDDKTALQNRVAELEQHNTMVELQRLREENASLQAKLAKATKAGTDITRERDILLRKLNGIKQLIDGPAVPQVYFPPLRNTLLTVFYSSTKEPAVATTYKMPNQDHPQPAMLNAFRTAFMTYPPPNTPSPLPKFLPPRAQTFPNP